MKFGIGPLSRPLISQATSIFTGPFLSPAAQNFDFAYFVTVVQHVYFSSVRLQQQHERTPQRWPMLWRRCSAYSACGAAVPASPSAWTVSSQSFFSAVFLIYTKGLYFKDSGFQTQSKMKNFNLLNFILWRDLTKAISILHPQIQGADNKLGQFLIQDIYATANHRNCLRYSLESCPSLL